MGLIARIRTRRARGRSDRRLRDKWLTVEGAQRIVDETASWQKIQAHQPMRIHRSWRSRGWLMATCISADGESELLLAVHERELEDQLAVLISAGRVSRRWHRGIQINPVVASEFKAALRAAISAGSADDGVRCY
jgi:hypothetical protein